MTPRLGGPAAVAIMLGAGLALSIKAEGWAGIGTSAAGLLGAYCGGQAMGVNIFACFAKKVPTLSGGSGGYVAPENNGQFKLDLGFDPEFGDNLSVHNIIDCAFDHYGTRYVLGGADPLNGIDCSNLTSFCYNQGGAGYGMLLAGGAQNYSLPQNWLSNGFSITSNPHYGDIIWWPSFANASYAHVGMYLNNAYFIGAQTSTGIAVAGYYLGSYWGNRPHLFLTYSGL